MRLAGGGAALRLHASRGGAESEPLLIEVVTLGSRPLDRYRAFVRGRRVLEGLFRLQRDDKGDGSIEDTVEGLTRDELFLNVLVYA